MVMATILVENPDCWLAQPLSLIIDVWRVLSHACKRVPQATNFWLRDAQCQPAKGDARSADAQQELAPSQVHWVGQFEVTLNTAGPEWIVVSLQQALLEGISLSQPQPKIPSELIKFLGKSFNAWHCAIPLLESHVILFNNVRPPCKL